MNKSEIKDDRKKPIITNAIKPGKHIDRTYLCPGKSTIVFYIPVRGEDGKPIKETDNRGQVKYNGSNPIYREKMMSFDSHGASANDSEVSICSFFLKKDAGHYDDIYDRLEEMRCDPSNMVMDSAMYGEYRNPQEAKALKKVQDLEKSNTEKDDVIARMHTEMEKMKKDMEQVTAPKKG